MAVQLAEARRAPGRAGAGLSDLSEVSGGGGNIYVRRAAEWSTDDELDVRWLFCDAPARAAGMRSNWGAACEAIRLGFHHLEASYVDPDAAMVDRLDAAERAGRIYRIMQCIDAEQLATLSAVYGGETPPLAIRQRWGDELGPVVLLMAPNAARFAKDEARSTELMLSARARLDAAKAGYASARAAMAGA